jgi:hypothetical protein
MAKPNFEIIFNIEPICKVHCIASNCVHNLWMLGEMACNLKHIDISADGRCLAFLPRPSKEQGDDGSL